MALAVQHPSKPGAGLALQTNSSMVNDGAVRPRIVPSIADENSEQNKAFTPSPGSKALNDKRCKKMFGNLRWLEDDALYDGVVYDEEKIKNDVLQWYKAHNINLRCTFKYHQGEPATFFWALFETLSTYRLFVDCAQLLMVSLQHLKELLGNDSHQVARFLNACRDAQGRTALQCLHT